jgi:hypothetical protein
MGDEKPMGIAKLGTFDSTPINDKNHLVSSDLAVPNQINLTVALLKLSGDNQHRIQLVNRGSR